MGESISATPVPAWAWIIAGVIIGGVAVAVTTQTPQPPAPAVDSVALKAQQKQLQVLNKRLERLETKPTAIPARRIGERPSPVHARPSSRQKPKVASKAEPTQVPAELAAADQRGQEARKVWVPPVVEDGHRFDDGVIVDMKPDYPAAIDPIPASAQTSQDDSIELKAAFPKGCPTCK